MYFYEQHIRDTAAQRATAVIDTLAAISALSGTEHVQEHLAALQAVALPQDGASPDSYTSSSNSNVIVI